MQHKCAQHKWDHFFVFKKLRNKCIRFERKKITHDETHFIKTNRERRRKKKRFFSHYLVSVKNRNSPVTFTLHFLIIYIYVHGFLLIICHCP